MKLPLFTLICVSYLNYLCCFFFNDPPTTEISPLSLHDALPILGDEQRQDHERGREEHARQDVLALEEPAQRARTPSRRHRHHDGDGNGGGGRARTSCHLRAAPTRTPSSAHLRPTSPHPRASCL